MANEGSVVLKVQEDITAHLKSIASTSVGCSKEFERLQRKVEDLGKRYVDFNRKSASLSALLHSLTRDVDKHRGAAASMAGTLKEAVQVRAADNTPSGAGSPGRSGTSGTSSPAGSNKSACQSPPGVI